MFHKIKKTVFILFLLTSCSKSIPIEPDFGLDVTGGDTTSGGPTSGSNSTSGEDSATGSGTSESDTSGGSGMDTSGEDTGGEIDPCFDITKDLIRHRTSLSISPGSRIFKGEPVTITWAVDLGTPIVTLKQDGSVLSQEMSGTKTFTPTENTTLTLEVSLCDFTVSKTKKVSFYQWVDLETPYANKAFLYSNTSKQELSFNENKFIIPKTTLWVAENDGALHLSKNGGTSWTKLFDNLPGSPQNNMEDSSKITSLEKISECDDQLFIGSQEGFVYKSPDDGLTIKGWNSSENEPVAYITDTNQNGLPIQFIIKDPNDDTGKTLIIGSSGGVFLQDCSAQTEFAFLLANELNPNYPQNTDRDFKSSGLFAGASFKNKTFFADEDGLWVTKDSFYGLADSAGKEVDALVSWEQVTDLPNSISWVKAYKNKLYVGTDSSIYISEDGNTWALLQNKEDTTNLFSTKDFDFYSGPTLEVYRKSTGQTLVIDDIQNIISVVSLGLRKIGFLNKDGRFYILNLNTEISSSKILGE